MMKITPETRRAH